MFITDTSCLILLEKIKAIGILQDIYTHVVTTPEVAGEFKEKLPVWIEIIPVKNISLIAIYQQQLDLGEASAIALAQEIADAILILDDLKGRKLAKQLDLRITGTIGVLIIARKLNKIMSLRPYFDMIQLTDFRIDSSLLERILSDFKD